MKITLIGVGSVVFGTSTIADLLWFKKDLNDSVLALVDTDEEKLELMVFFAEKMNAEAGCPFKIIADTDRKKVLEKSDFVVTSPAVRREDLWEADWRIIHGAGIRQTYGESGGPGSLSHTLRNIPIMRDICTDIEALAPDAVVINFTNPEARICHYIDKYTSLRFVGLCHQIFAGYRTVGRVLNMPFEDLDIKAAGINHFTWMYDIRQVSTGLSIYQQFLEKIQEMPSEFEPISRKLSGIFGMYPTAGDHHLSEFLSFAWEYQGIHGRDFAQFRREKAEALEWLRGVRRGDRKISEKIQGRSNESVVDIIAAMAKGNNCYQVSVDIRNNGCIPNLPADAIVEVPGLVSGDGVRGLHMKSLPEGIASLIRQQLTIQHLSVEAAITGDRHLALEVMILDPVVDSVVTAEKVLDNLLEEHRQYIHPGFFSESV